MKHALRKYLSPCGSALFMVVSTMAALTVLVTAMYMSVLSSRQVQYATFDQEQAYVTSTSVADIFTAYISDSKNASATIMKKISTMKAGQTITTNGNDFAAFGGTKEDSAIGAYTVDIKRLNNETISGVDWNVYDVAVTVQKNGIAETTHSLVRSKNGEPTQMEPIDRFFTSTGYLPNDVWISSVTTDSTLYCDNEYTIFSKDKYASGDGDVNINMDIVCAGAALFNDKTTIKPVSKPMTWIFGNNVTFGQGCTISDFNLGTSSENGKIIVGGDMTLEGNNAGKTFPANVDVYVMGNLYLGKNVYAFFNGNLYVKGDIIAESDKSHSFSSVYVNGTMKQRSGDDIKGTLNNKGTCPDNVMTDAENIMNSRIGGSVFPKWQAETAGLPIENIYFNTDDTNQGASAKYIHYIDHDCTIGNVKDIYGGSGDSVNLTIVIDTGDDPQGVRTLSVMPNCDDVGVDDTFMWYPEASPSGGKTITILTVGQGTLVIDVPDGVTYQASDQEFFGHIAWFMIAGGSIKETAKGAPYFSRNTSLSPGLQSQIHNSSFILQEDDGTCSYRKVGSGKDSYYVCDSHGGSYEEHNVKTVEEGKKDTLCVGRILKDKIDAYYVSHASVKSNIVDYYSNYFGEFRNGSSGYSLGSYYPNVNIFVISVLENADIQFGCKKSDNSSIMENVYCGYVYAPYMTYVSIGSGGGLKNVGGLIVSDIALSGAYEYIFAQPERTITQISGEDMEALQPSGSRTWRVHGY